MNLFKKLFYISVLILITIAANYVSSRNDAAVPIDLVFWKSDAVTIWSVMFLSFFSGALFIVLLLFIDVMKVNFNERRLKKENRKLKKEINDIRNHAVADVDEYNDAAMHGTDVDDSFEPDLPDMVDEKEAQEELKND